MHAIATQPDLYEVLVENNVISSLLQLLSHENTDIVAAVIGLLQVRMYATHSFISILFNLRN